MIDRVYPGSCSAASAWFWHASDDIVYKLARRGKPGGGGAYIGRGGCMVWCEVCDFV